MERVLVVANRHAGAGRAGQLAATVVVAARRRGHTVELADPDGVDGLRATVAAAVADGVQRVVAVGGDGLVHHVVQEVAGRDVVLGLVPCGTGNDFALGLGITAGRTPTTLATGALASPMAVDGLRTDHGWVASLATVGFSASVNERAEAMAWPRGARRYTRATLQALPGLRTTPMVLTVDGVAHELDVTLLALGTTAYFGGAMAICPEADVADGRSDVTVIGRCGRIELLRAFPRVFAGTHLSHRAVRTMAGVELVLTSPEPDVSVRADGEAVGNLPLRATTVPGALQVAGASQPRLRSAPRS